MASAKMKADPSLKQHEANRAVLAEHPSLAKDMQAESREIRSRREAFSRRESLNA
jgi:hypothetical protein